MTGTQNRDFWSEQKIEKVKTLLAQKWSYGDIGHAIDCTRNAISGMIMRLRAKGELPPATMDIYRRPKAMPLHKPLPAPPKRPQPSYSIKPKLKAITLPQNPEQLLRAISEPLRGKPVLIVNISKDGCYWPVSQNDKGVDLFCNEKRLQNSSWCAAHKERAVIRKSSSHGMTG